MVTVRNGPIRSLRTPVANVEDGHQRQERDQRPGGDQREAVLGEDRGKVLLHGLNGVEADETDREGGN